MSVLIKTFVVPLIVPDRFSFSPSSLNFVLLDFAVLRAREIEGTYTDMHVLTYRLPFIIHIIIGADAFYLTCIESNIEHTTLYLPIPFTQKAGCRIIPDSKQPGHKTPSQSRHTTTSYSFCQELLKFRVVNSLKAARGPRP